MFQVASIQNMAQEPSDGEKFFGEGKIWLNETEWVEIVTSSRVGSCLSVKLPL